MKTGEKNLHMLSQTKKAIEKRTYIRLYMRVWRNKNRKHLRAYQKQYAKKPAQKLYNKQYYAKNKEKFSKNFKIWAKENPEIVRYHGYKYFQNHKVQVRKRHKKYRQLHIHKITYWNSSRRARKFQNGGSHTLQQWLHILQKTYGYCPKCKLYFGCKKLTKDHIKPLSKGGTDDIKNIQVLCQKCNSSKKNKEE